VPVAPPPLPANVGRDAGAPDEPYAVVVGDLFRYKGVEVVSRALAAMEPAERPLVLVCGRRPDPSYAARLDREIAARGVGDRVRFLGSVERDRVLRLLAGSLACIAPSRFENKSYVPIEAMAVGAPVVAADIPATHESCGDAARYFDPDRPGELAEHLRALLDDPTAGRRMAEAGRARVAPMRPTDAAEPILEGLEELVR